MQGALEYAQLAIGVDWEEDARDSKTSTTLALVNLPQYLPRYKAIMEWKEKIKEGSPPTLVKVELSEIKSDMVKPRETE